MTLGLIQFWKFFFESQVDLLPNFDWYYQVIKSKGVQFPVLAPSKYLKNEIPQRNPILPINYSDEEINMQRESMRNSKRSHNNGNNKGNDDVDFVDTSDFNEKKMKLYRDLLVVLENIDLTNSIINEKGDKEILKSMVVNLNQMESKFEALKRKLKVSGEQKLFRFTEELLAEIMKIYDRVNNFNRNRKTAGSYFARNFLRQKCRDLRCFGSPT